MVEPAAIPAPPSRSAVGIRHEISCALFPGAIVDRGLVGGAGRHEAPAKCPLVIVVEAVARIRHRRRVENARELEVLQVAASGVPSAEIADQLHLSVGTVRNYMASAVTKLGGRNRVDAVRIATDAGWL